ncbi:MAG: hypothetical protein GYA60_05615 [Candidatus Methanofastidiosa archaeon]|nr:hypothetical protein [Candidatus Methanofastidiosa archaeon]
MLLESITPKELQIYILIGTFIISLFIDIIFSINRKEWRFYTFSIYALLLWTSIAFGLYMNYSWNRYEKWSHGIYLFFQIFYFLVGQIFYFSLQLRFKLDFEKKDPDCYVDSLKYSIGDVFHLKITKEIFVMGILFAIANVVFWSKIGTAWVGNVWAYTISIIFVVFTILFSYLYYNSRRV